MHVIGTKKHLTKHSVITQIILSQKRNTIQNLKEFIITERRVDRNEVKKYIKSTGHIPDGVDVEFHDREKFHYKLDN